MTSLEATVSFFFGGSSGIEFYYESEAVVFIIESVLYMDNELKADNVTNTAYNRRALLEEKKKWGNFHDSVVREENTEKWFGDMKFSYRSGSSRMEIGIGSSEYKFAKTMLLSVIQTVMTQLEDERKGLKERLDEHVAENRRAKKEAERLAKEKAEREERQRQEFVAREAAAAAHTRPECNVCYESFEGTILECGHWTCDDCLLKFTKPECAVCRRQLVNLKPAVLLAIAAREHEARISTLHEQRQADTVTAQAMNETPTAARFANAPVRPVRRAETTSSAVTAAAASTPMRADEFQLQEHHRNVVRNHMQEMEREVASINEMMDEGIISRGDGPVNDRIVYLRMMIEQMRNIINGRPMS